MPALDIFERSTDMTYGGQNVVNVEHLQQIGADGTGTWQASLFTNWDVAYKPRMRNLMTAQVNIVQVRMRRVLPTQTQQTTTTVNEAGLHAGDGMPPHIASLLRQHGETTGRKGTGGIKFTGIPNTEVLNGRITVAYAALMELYGDQDESDITDGATGYTFRGGVLSQVDDVFRKILKSYATPRVVTVYSRQRGVGQ